MEQAEYLKKFKEFYEGSDWKRTQYLVDDNFIYDGIKYLTPEQFNSIACEIVRQRPELLEDEIFLQALKEEAFKRMYPVISAQLIRKSHGLK